jgi:hypothetical protein
MITQHACEARNQLCCFELRMAQNRIEKRIGAGPLWRALPVGACMAEDVLVFVQHCGLNSLFEVGRGPGTGPVGKDNRKGLVYDCFVVAQVRRRIGGGLKAKEIETEKAAGSEVIRLLFPARSPIEDADNEPVLVNPKPGSARDEVLAR